MNCPFLRVKYCVCSLPPKSFFSTTPFPHNFTVNFFASSPVFPRTRLSVKKSPTLRCSQAVLRIHDILPQTSLHNAHFTLSLAIINAKPNKFCPLHNDCSKRFGSVIDRPIPHTFFNLYPSVSVK